MKTNSVSKKTIVAAAVMSFLSLSATHTLAADTNQPEKQEKCYGIVKKAMNDCQTKTASCAGSATTDNQKDAFLFLPKGACEKITGGSLKPIDDNKK